MNFFEHQARAQQKTGYLYLLMGLAVTCLIVMSCVMLAAVIGWQNPEAPSALEFWKALSPRAIALTAGGIGFTIVSASLYEYMQLRRGGAAVAEALGGQLIARNTTNLNEKRVLNVVEEMAIASGVSVPPVYLIKDLSINAFAAGHSIDDAAIGVTQGCINHLTRDELQGVIAHEFSHIFHGDMRINMRLSALLFGILFIALAGQHILRHSPRSSGNSRGNNPLPLIGVALIVLGYCGVFFANMIKAAVSRQREFLADASAVQYTRNPEGIAGALAKIELHGSRLRHPNAAQFTHMYFSFGVREVEQFFATHPPLKARMQRLNVSLPALRARAAASATAAFDQPENSASAPTQATCHPSDVAAVVAGMVTASALAQTAEPTATIGQPTPEHLDFAQHLIASLPDDIHLALQDPYRARGLILGLFLTKTPDAQQLQIAHIDQSRFRGELDDLLTTARRLLTLPAEYRLPILELALPSIKQLPEHLIDALLAAVNALINSDGKTHIDEWTLQSILQAHLRPKDRATTAAPTPEKQALLLSAVSWIGHANEARARAAFMAAHDCRDELFQPRTVINLKQLDECLDSLNQLPILKKLALLKQVVTIIEFDGTEHYREIEMLRTICARLHCPMPPRLKQRS